MFSGSVGSASGRACDLSTSIQEWAIVASSGFAVVKGWVCRVAQL